AARPPLLPDHPRRPDVRAPRGARPLLPGEVQAPGPRSGAVRRATRPGALLEEPDHGRVGGHPRPDAGGPVRHAPHTEQHLVRLMGRRVLVTGLGTFWGGRVAQAIERASDVDVIVGVDSR